MLEKLKEVLGLISGYKQECDALKSEMGEAEAVINEILFILRNWYGTASNKSG